MEQNRIWADFGFRFTATVWAQDPNGILDLSVHTRPPVSRTLHLLSGFMGLCMLAERHYVIFKNLHVMVLRLI